MVKGKRVIIAPDSFKGCLTADEISHAVSLMIRREFSNIEPVEMPVADGGEGTVAALCRGMRRVRCEVRDPLMRIMEAEYAEDGCGTAYIEVAAASGLTLLDVAERNPLMTSSVGTGELVRHALARGNRVIVLGLGGSATNDGGTGLLAALGVDFGVECLCGGSLLDIVRVDVSNLMPEAAEARFVLAVDVESPFVGEGGASRVFAPQKGASADVVEFLERGMEHLASLLPVDIRYLRGAGAAGGIAGGLYSLLPCEITSGIDLVLDGGGFADALIGADLVITGEGSVDSQSLMGKVLSGILRRASVAGVPVVSLAGRVDERERLLSAGLRDVVAVTPSGMSLDEALRKEVALKNILCAARNICELL